MMSNMGGQKVLEMKERSKKKEQEIIESEPSWTSKLIIPPNNFWNMQWNNFITTVFVFYIFIAPIFISYDTKFVSEQFKILLFFDILFILDRIADLFAGFYKPDGQMESKLTNVIEHNLSSKLFLEFVISFGPLIWDPMEINTMVYALFKLPRYVRLFELDK